MLNSLAEVATWPTSISLDISDKKELVSGKYFSYLSIKTYGVGTHKEAFLMSIHNICSHREMREIPIPLDWGKKRLIRSYVLLL